MFKTLNSEITYQGKAFDVRRDQVLLPDGRTTHLDIVDHKGSVALLPIDSRGQIWFVRQYRHATQQELLELPAGVLNEGELPEVCAQRELREEIGMAAGSLQKIGGFFLAPGYSTEYMYAYYASDLQPDPLRSDADEFLSVEKIPTNQVFDLIKAGRIRDSKTLAVLLLARLAD